MNHQARRSIFFEANEHTLALARIVVFGLWLAVLLSSPPLENLAALPAEQFNPLGFFRLLPGSARDILLSSSCLWTLRWSAVVLLALTVLGVRPYRPIALAACVLLVLIESILKGYAGFLNHAQFAPLFAALILAVSPAADALILRRRVARRPPEHYVAAVLTLGMACAMMYLFVGSRRVSAGIDVFWGDKIPLWFATRALTQNSYGFEAGALVLTQPWLDAITRIGFVVITALEVLTPLVLFNNTFRKIWLAVMAPFHLSTLFLMNIFFWENVVLLLALLTELGYRVGRPNAARDDAPPVVFYDGVCGLCDRAVRWIMARDRDHQFRFAPLQGRTAAERIGPRRGEATEWSIVLVDERGQHEGSDASLRIMARLGGAWGVLGSALLYIPRPIRDAAYRFIARRRYAWFGTRDACPIGTRADQQWMLD